MKKFIMAVIIFLTLPALGMAATWYVRAGATGTGTGADWTNAYTNHPPR